MLQIIILRVGNPESSYWKMIGDEYRKRLENYAKVTIHSIKASTIDDVQQKIKVETQAITDFLERYSQFTTVLLDLNGKLVTSEAISDLIKQSKDFGTGKLLWIIGGSNGVASTLKRDKKVIKIAFGHITIPHQLCLVLLLEQLYRGFQIINHQPYHK